MARSIVDLDGQTIHRAVLFKLFPGVHDLELKTYTDADGEEYHYHKVLVNGPYEGKGQATAQLNRMIKDHNRLKEQKFRLEDGTYSPAGGYAGRWGSPNGSVPEVRGFVEYTNPAWSLAAPVKEA